jgi:sulfoxide reductase heme-binding subunit YedZ
MAAVDGINAFVRKCPVWVLYVSAVAPVVWLFAQAFTGGLGVDPVKSIEHQMGLWALWLAIAGLAVTPLGRLANLRLIKFRRAIGLITFFYILVHLLVWLFLDVQIMEQVWKDILKRPYITIGMFGFVLMIPLAITSNNWSVRKLGAASWRNLHKLTYPAVFRGGLHYLMLVRGWQYEPMIYLAVIVGLLMLRIRWKKFALRRATVE